MEFIKHNTLKYINDLTRIRIWPFCQRIIQSMLDMVLGEALIFTPLGLPLEAAITLMLAIDPIMTLVNVHTNCAATAIIAKPSV